MKWIGTQTIYDHVRLNKGITIDSVSITTIQSSGESFADNDTSLMTSAAILDKIQATASGDITGVAAGVGLSGGGTSGDVTLTLDLSELSAVTPVNGDSLATLDSDGSTEQLTTVAALATLFAGSGLTATNSIIAVDTLNQNTTGSSATCTGNAATATALANPRAINGVEFDGTGDITITAAGSTLSDTVTVAKGGTGATSLTDGGILLGSGTSAVTAMSVLGDGEMIVGDGTTDPVAESGDTLRTSIGCNPVAGSSSITTLGTIGTGTWQGTAIASAYLDADTAHYSATRQVTHHMITDDIDSDVIYISLGEIDSEGTSATGKHLPLIAPTAGKLLKIFLRTSVNYSSETFTWKLYTRNVSASTGGSPSEIGAQSGAGPTNKTMVTYDFTTGLDSGTNAIAAGDKVQISIEAGDGATANGNYFITCMWEWDLS